MPTLEKGLQGILAAKGEAMASNDPLVAALRDLEPAGPSRVGFDIATGTFGDPALGALGNTLPGPGSAAIRDALHPAGQRGFNDSMVLNLKSKK
jgi:hypothetical protein